MGESIRERRSKRYKDMEEYKGHLRKRVEQNRVDGSERAVSNPREKAKALKSGARGMIKRKR